MGLRARVGVRVEVRVGVRVTVREGGPATLLGGSVQVGISHDCGRAPRPIAIPSEDACVRRTYARYGAGQRGPRVEYKPDMAVQLGLSSGQAAGWPRASRLA